MPCNVSSAVEDDRGENQLLHQTTSSTLLLEECEFRNAEESSGIYEAQHETVIPSSLIGECEPNNGAVSSIKSTKLEDHRLCADTMLSNEQVQLTWTTGIVDSATTKANLVGISKEEGINSDFCLLEGQISRDDIADLKTYPTLNDLQSGLHKHADTPATTMISNEPVDSQADKCIDHVGTHKSGKNVGYIQDAEEVTPTTTVDEKIETSEGIDTCISDRSDDPIECEKNHK